MTDQTQAAWPCDPAVRNCDAVAVAATAIMSGAMDAPYAGCSNGEDPKACDIAFWERVSEERERIARWVISGLSISGRAADVIPAAPSASETKPG